MSYARAGDVEIYYELHGPRVGAGRAPAVLVMGLGSDANAWEKQIAALAGDRPVLVLDNRGVGRSGKPRGPYSTALLADDLALVMDAAGIQTAHVAGISLGG
ncbi:MAG TPA: alpha/beta fold hydrolase, partial [Minicystis sp.]|nr:alpha/beta fold hydrolase [Minicystis sp.]